PPPSRADCSAPAGVPRPSRPNGARCCTATPASPAPTCPTSPCASPPAPADTGAQALPDGDGQAGSPGAPAVVGADIDGGRSGGGVEREVALEGAPVAVPVVVQVGRQGAGGEQQLGPAERAATVV